MARASIRSLVSASAVVGGLLLILAIGGVAFADDYEGNGDTGWMWDNERDCCDDAVTRAQNDSAARCSTSGGEPKVRPGQARGMCDWDTQGDGDNQVYRCTATATVSCW
jgi:hypothetical protein